MSLTTLLEPSLLAELEAWRLRTRLQGRGLLEGMHHTQRWGHAATFAGHREYSPGDDLRRLDWRASARSGRWQIKRFERETELTAHLIVDASGSMGYAGAGRRSKLEYGKRLAAGLAYLLIASRDRVGFLTAVGRTNPLGEDKDVGLPRLPARTGPAHLTKVVDALSVLEPQGAVDLISTMSRLGIALSHRSLLVLISDFFVETGPLLEVLGLLASQGHELLLLQVLDEDELTFPFDGETRFVSMEVAADDPQSDATSKWIDTDASQVRDQYLRRLHALVSSLAEGAKAQRMRFFTLTTDRPIGTSLRMVLEGIG